jgi:hypothetical protein
MGMTCCIHGFGGKAGKEETTGRDYLDVGGRIILKQVLEE